MDILDTMLDRIIDAHHNIETPKQAETLLNAMTNSEVLAYLSSIFEDLFPSKP